MAKSDNRLIAKNTLLLYFRMGIVTIIGLYTSRVILASLGIIDYGIYGLVGSIVTIIGFLNASMSNATSRFLTFELGTGDTDKLKNTFTASFVIHVAIALFVVVITETVGVWFLNNELIIPEDKIYAANWVLQISIISSVFGITQVPYTALLFAHEKFNIFAYIEIITSVLKLAIAYLVYISPFEKLIFYASALLSLNLAITITYRLICINKYKESHLERKIDKSIAKPLLSFISNNFGAHLAYNLRIHGCGYALNMIFGVVVNAAIGLVGTVTSIVQIFTYNILSAFKPQIIKRYAEDDFSEMSNLIHNAVKYGMVIFMYIAVPLYLNVHYLLFLWLGEVPQYTEIFCKIGLLTVILGGIGLPVEAGLMATGRIKRYSFITMVIYTITPFVCYAICKYTNNAYLGFSIIYIAQIFTTINAIVSFKTECPQFRLRNFIKFLFKDVVFCLLLAFFITRLTIVAGHDIRNLFLSTITAFIVTTTYTMATLKAEQRRQIITLCKSKLDSFIKR